MPSFKWYDGSQWHIIGDPTIGQVKVSSADTFPHYLETKILTDNGIGKESLDSQLYSKRIHLFGVPATATTLGMIKVGENLEISEDGTLSAIGGGTGGVSDGRIKISNVDSSTGYISEKIQFSPSFTTEALNGGAGLIYLITGKPATNTTLGMVKAGQGLSIGVDGTLSIAGAGVGGAFTLDDDGNVQPAADFNTDSYYEKDGFGDIMPKES